MTVFQMVCPVCREDINYKLEDLNSVPVEDSFVFIASAEMRDMQARMEAILIRQKANGGIIDVEAEKNKYLVKNDVCLCAYSVTLFTFYYYTNFVRSISHYN